MFMDIKIVAVARPYGRNGQNPNESKFRPCVIGVLLLLMGILLAGCLPRTPQWIQRLQSGDYSIVEIGHYPNTTHMITSPSIYDNEITKFKKVIDKHSKIMQNTAKHFFENEIRELNFKYRFASLDRKANVLIIRYFAQLPYPYILAGYEEQFIVDLETHKVTKIFVREVPLEI
jgi:hypothetical protein